jgi:mannose-6-phosphate isomerase-like protein (cupin superfamily)
MKRATLDEMVGGWFIGDFTPTVLATGDVEVAVKRYTAGERDARHHHRVATEVTVLVEGRARMGETELAEGDIVLLEAGESSDFEALTDVTLVAIKHPGALNDKYLDG